MELALDASAHVFPQGHCQTIQTHFIEIVIHTYTMGWGE